MFSHGTKIGPYMLVRRLRHGNFGDVWLAAIENGNFRPGQFRLEIVRGDGPLSLGQLAASELLWQRIGWHANIAPPTRTERFESYTVLVQPLVSELSLDERLRLADIRHNEAVRIIIGILKGLEHIHSHGVVHRDLKPANILLDGDQPLITEFGIACEMRSSNDGAVAGTLNYMAPEAFSGDATPQTDIWSVGVIFYEMLTGSLPFPQQSVHDLVTALRTLPVDLRPDVVPYEMSSILRRALAKGTDERYRSALEMRLDLERGSSLWKGDGEMAAGPMPVDCSPGSAGPTPDEIPIVDCRIAGDDPDRTRPTDSIGNLVKRVGRFFGKK